MTADTQAPSNTKLSIDGLERLLQRESDAPVRILPDGTVELVPAVHTKEQHAQDAFTLWWESKPPRIDTLSSFMAGYASALLATERATSEPPVCRVPDQVYVILNEDGLPEFVATDKMAAEDHITDAIATHDIEEAGKWKAALYVPWVCTCKAHPIDGYWLSIQCVQHGNRWKAEGAAQPQESDQYLEGFRDALNSAAITCARCASLEAELEAARRPAHLREPPHCSTCGCGLPAQPPLPLRPGLERAIEIVSATETPSDYYDEYRDRLVDALDAAIGSSETKESAR